MSGSESGVVSTILSMEHIAYLTCIVVAAGSGRRFHSEIPKQFLPLAGRSMLAHSLERVCAAVSTGGLSGKSRLIVVLSPGCTMPADCTRVPMPLTTVDGGATRQQSVRCALKLLEDEPGSAHDGLVPAGPGHWVLIHDGDRPCVEPDDIVRLLRACRRFDGGFLCYPLTDSLVAVQSAGADGCHTAAVPLERERHRLAATPRLFTTQSICRSHRLARRSGDNSGGDDASLVIRAGYAVTAVESSSNNLKVTFARDLAAADDILSRPARHEH